MTARLVPLAELEAWLAKGWRLSRRPLQRHHGRYGTALIVRDDATDPVLMREAG